MITREEIQEKVDLIKEKLKKHKVIYHYAMTSIFIIGVLFFFNSNHLFNKEMSYKSTTIKEEYKLNSGVAFSIIERKYNPDTGLIELLIKRNGNEFNSDLNFNFEIRERKDPMTIVDSNVVQIEEKYYVITTNIFYNWSTVSLTIIEEKDEVTGNSIKFYSDKKDIEEDKELEIKSENEYVIKVIDIEIEEVNEEINKNNLSIEDRKSKIEKSKEAINKIKDDMKYQTNLEIEESKSNISSLEDDIKTKESEIKTIEESSKELNEKIKKLEEKKKNFK